MHFWHDSLYTPLLNFMMFLYSGPAFGNLGIAVIELTVLLRIALLPLSILEERNKYKYEKLNKQVEAIERDFQTDHVLRKDKVRELLRHHKVNYWSKVLVLGIQLLVLILLYQVFIGGIKFTHQEVLYSWVTPPIMVNTMFFGYDISERSFLWAGIVAGFLFANIYISHKRSEHLINKSDIIYLFLFPVFTLLVLWLLPMVKSIFVLTSMLFSILLLLVRKTFFKVPNLGPLKGPKG